jgi:hypothetical protein
MMKKFKNSLVFMPNKYRPIIKCAVDEIGKNSVIPSIIPKIIV